MNLLDIIICIPLLWGIYKGFTKGFIFEVALLIALILGVWGGLHFASFASDYLQPKFNIHGRWLFSISFLIIFLGIVVLLILFAKFLEGMVKITGLGIFNRLLGAMFGAAKWLFIIGIVFHLLQSIDTKDYLLSQEKKEKSFLYVPAVKLTTWLIPELKKIKKNIAEPTNEQEKNF